MTQYYGVREYRFEAAHREYACILDDSENADAYGRAKFPHGHNFVLWAQVAGTKHPKSDMIVDLGDLDNIVENRVLKKWDHFYFDALTSGTQYTLEHITTNIWKDLREGVDLLSHITLFESDKVWCDYNGDDSMIDITRSYTFDAAHRTVNASLSDEENKKLYGKCFNLHGHTYTLDVTIRGKVNPQTAQIVSPHKMDESVEKVLDQFDYKVLNHLEFIDNPTTENLVQKLWELLSEQLITDKIIKNIFQPTNRLFKLRLRETGRNFFEYYGV